MASLEEEGHGIAGVVVEAAAAAVSANDLFECHIHNSRIKHFVRLAV